MILNSHAWMKSKRSKTKPTRTYKLNTSAFIILNIPHLVCLHPLNANLWKEPHLRALLIVFNTSAFLYPYQCFNNGECIAHWLYDFMWAIKINQYCVHTWHACDQHWLNSTILYILNIKKKVEWVRWRE